MKSALLLTLLGASRQKMIQKWNELIFQKIFCIIYIGIKKKSSPLSLKFLLLRGDFKLPLPYAVLAKLAIASAFQAEDRGFESRIPLHSCDLI